MLCLLEAQEAKLRAENGNKLSTSAIPVPSSEASLLLITIQAIGQTRLAVGSAFY